MDASNQIFESAVDFHKKNDLTNAEKKYREYLKINPKNSQCLFILGTLLIQEERYMDAIIELKKSTKEDPKNFHSFQNLGIAYFESKQFDDAIDAYKISIALNNKNADSFNNLGNCLHKTGKFNEAIESFNLAIKLWPNKSFIFNRAKSYSTSHNYKKALEDLALFEEPSPLFRKAEDMKAKIYSKIGSFKLAIPIYESKIKNYDRNDSIYKKSVSKEDIYVALIGACSSLEDQDKVKKWLPIFAKEFPGSLNVLRCQAHEAYCEKRYEDSIYLYKEIIKIKPNSASALNNLAITYQNIGDLDLGKVYLKKALNVDKTHVQANISFGIMLLKEKKFTQAWPHYEYRLLTEQFRSHKLSYIFYNRNLPKWDGRNDKSSVLLYGEQGIGDQLCLSKLLTKIVRFQNQFTIPIDKRLLPILKRSFPYDNFNFVDHKISIEGFFDSQAAIFRLGFLFVNHEQHIKSPFKYFLANKLDTHEKEEYHAGFFPKLTEAKPIVASDAENQEKTIKNVNNFVLPPDLQNNHSFSKKVRCGISWYSQNRGMGYRKSIELTDLIKASGVNNDFDYINLQYGDHEKEIASAEKNNNIKINRYNNLDKYNDIDGLFSLVDSCDVVITISNVTAHIAGSLGKKTYLILAHGRGWFWYWMKYKETNTSLWYPSIEIIQSNDPFSLNPCLELLQTKLKDITP
jgi:tetratricopeptide (TPR) repeat protein